MTAFDAALDEVLSYEGGYSDNPNDPGGMTNLGVTRHVWEQWTGEPASEADMRDLTRAVVAPLYRKQYWDACSCDKLPAGLALCVFDFAVNGGAARAARFLQRLVGVNQDGAIGQRTLSAVGQFVGSVGEGAAIHRYQDMRRDYYKALPTFPTFGRGWLNRCDAVELAAMRLA